MTIPAEALFDISGYSVKGFCVIPGFSEEKEVFRMKSRMTELVAEWIPDEAVDSIFTTKGEQRRRDNYFVDSAEVVRFFLEEEAVDAESGKIKEGIAKEELINKAGHGLHVSDDVFREFASSRRVNEVVRALGYRDAVVPQSMYIFKQPRMGGQVGSHQDSAFLHTYPELSCLGLWLALDEACLENGCLWVRPGSHTEALRRRYVRDSEGKVGFVWIEEPKYEAKLIDNPSEHGFIPVPVKSGDMVVIHGSLDHMSLANRSSKARHSFQLHLVEGPKAGIYWSDNNWLQYPAGKSFMSISA